MNAKEDTNKFWSGFSIGAIAGSVILYAFATKKGRKTIQSLLKGSESLEHDLEGILELLKKNPLSQKTK